MGLADASRGVATQVSGPRSLVVRGPTGTAARGSEAASRAPASSASPDRKIALASAVRLPPTSLFPVGNKRVEGHDAGRAVLKLALGLDETHHPAGQVAVVALPIFAVGSTASQGKSE